MSTPSEPGPSPSTEPGPDGAPTTEAMTRRAVEDLATRLGVDSRQIKVISARPVTWPDGSLGCPKPGHHYTQALVEGFRATLVHGEVAYDYHAGADGRPFLCPSKEKPGGGYAFYPPPGIDS